MGGGWWVVGDGWWVVSRSRRHDVGSGGRLAAANPSFYRVDHFLCRPLVPCSASHRTNRLATKVPTRKGRAKAKHGTSSSRRACRTVRLATGTLLHLTPCNPVGNESAHSESTGESEARHKWLPGGPFTDSETLRHSGRRLQVPMLAEAWGPLSFQPKAMATKGQCPGRSGVAIPHHGLGRPRQARQGAQQQGMQVGGG